jgi:nucleotide-binding universal stress UspA family protein
VDEALCHAEELLMKRADQLEPILGRRPGVRLLADEGSETIDGIAITLLDAAREASGPTLLVVGSRGMGPLKRVRMGSVSTKAGRAASGPVLVCPPRPAAAEFAGSANSAVALRSHSSEQPGQA